MNKFDDVPVPWPHGTYDKATGRYLCPDDAACAVEKQWAHPCEADTGGGFMCERLPPPGGWDDPDLPFPEPDAGL